jgi:hypothetical protein
MSLITDILSGAYNNSSSGGSNNTLPAVLTALGIGGAGGLMVKDAYDNLGTVGTTANTGATAIANEGISQTAFQPYGVMSSTGSQFQYDPETGQVTNTLGEAEQGFQDNMFANAQNMYNQAAMPTANREQDIYGRIRAAQMPGEERDRMALEERLASQGRLGVQTNQYGGTPQELAMAKAQAEAQNTAYLGAMTQAQAEQMQQARLGEGMLASSYLPQAQLTDLQAASSYIPQLQQRGQEAGAALYGDARMGGLQALLGAAQGQGNMMGNIGAGLLTGLFR